MWEFFSQIAAEFAKGGLVVLMLACLFAGSIFLLWLQGRRNDAKLTAKDVEIATANAKIEAVRAIYELKYDGVLDKYNAAMLASTRQTDGYIEAGRQMKDLLVEVKTAVGGINDKVIRLEAINKVG